MSILKKSQAAVYLYVGFVAPLTPKQRWKLLNHIIRYIRRYPDRDPPAMADLQKLGAI